MRVGDQAIIIKTNKHKHSIPTTRGLLFATQNIGWEIVMSDANTLLHTVVQSVSVVQCTTIDTE